MRLLLEGGVDVDNARTDVGATPLFMASQNGHDGVVRVLLEAGADVHKASTDHGLNPLLVDSS